MIPDAWRVSGGWTMSDMSGSTCPVDLADGLARVGDDAEFFKELIEMFLEDAPERLDTIHRSIQDANAEEVSREAHGIKGAAANLSANQIRDIAREMESAGKDGDLSALTSLFQELRREFDRLAEFAKTL